MTTLEVCVLINVLRFLLILERKMKTQLMYAITDKSVLVSPEG